MQTRVPALGPRGEGWVILQTILLALIVAGAVFGVARQTEPPAEVKLLGTAFVVAGLLLMAWAGASLGSFLTPFPRPTDRHALITSGPFCWVRHPIYSGLLLAALGGCLVSGSWLAVASSLCLAVLFDLKARREEAWLADRHPEYLDYRRRTHKFVPAIY